MFARALFFSLFQSLCLVTKHFPLMFEKKITSSHKNNNKLAQIRDLVFAATFLYNINNKASVNTKGRLIVSSCNTTFFFQVMFMQ